MSIIQGTSKASGGGYEIDQSILFDKTTSSRLQLTQGTPDGTSWTLSWWMKRGNLDASEMWFINGGNAYPDYIRFETSEKIRFRIFSRGIDNTTTAVFRDPSAWYHFVANWNGSTGAYNLWQNNVSLISGTGSSGETYYNKSGEFFSLGSQGGGGNYYDGYLSEIVKLDNTVADPTSFGEYNDSGVWVPKAYTGAYGDNGFYITGEDSADLGADYSGNGNDFTSSGLTSDDQVTDTPTRNYATYNPLGGGTRGTLSNGNKKMTGSSVNGSGKVGSMAFPATGKYYMEFIPTYIQLSGAATVGVTITENLDPNTFNSRDNNNVVNYQDNGQKRVVATTSAYGASWVANDVIGMTMNMDDGEVTFYKNNVSQGVAYTGLNSDYPNNTWTFYTTEGYGAQRSDFLLQIADSELTYTPPAGYSTLSTANLPTPAIKDGSKYFQTTLYTGNSSTQEINQSGNSTFQPDFVWVKTRSTTYDHTVFDAVRGVENIIRTNSTAAELSDSTSLTSFDADGYTVGSRSSVNQSGETFAAWQWLAANGTASNSDGSITSTVSANTTAGFSIITWTGNGTASATIGHGLSAAPEFFIVKNRSNTDYWAILETVVNGGTHYLTLPSTAAANSNSSFWTNTNPTSSVITLGTQNRSNGSGDSMVGYAFHSVDGFSKIGKYTGNGNSTNGPLIYTDFKPAWVMTKKTNSTSAWTIFDNQREGYNVDNDELVANTSAAETTTDYLDLLSNGFKLRSTDADVNASGSTFIYLAFAEHPFGGDGVAPVPAR